MDAVDELRRYWALAFENGSTHSCGLLAHEEQPRYTGFWTDDPETVAAIRRRLESARS